MIVIITVIIIIVAINIIITTVWAFLITPFCGSFMWQW